MDAERLAVVQVRPGVSLKEIGREARRAGVWPDVVVINRREGGRGRDRNGGGDGGGSWLTGDGVLHGFKWVRARESGELF